MRLRASSGGDIYSPGICARISSPLRQTGALLSPRPVEARTRVSPSPSISPAVLLI